MAIEIFSPASHIIRATREILFTFPPLSDDEIYRRWYSDATPPSKDSKFEINTNGALVLKSERPVINELEEKIRNDWLEKSIVPPEGSGYEIDSNNYLRRTEDLDREERQLERLERELQEILIPLPDPVVA